jgi:hypothetical protein
MTVGDFDGDGFEDLAAAANNNSVWVMRGTTSGLLPPLDSGVSSYASFTQLPMIPTSTDQVTALGVLKNGYYSAANSRVKDVLFVGKALASSGSRVQVCKPTTNPDTGISFNSDAALNFAWDCTQSLTNPDSGKPRFGTSIASLPNGLRYKPKFVSDPDDGIHPYPHFGNISSTSTKLGAPGAVVIGSLGAFYVYFGVANPGSFSGGQPGYNIAGDSRGHFGDSRNLWLAHLSSVSVVTTSPCSVKASKSAGSSQSFDYCDALKVSVNGNTEFGSVLASLSGDAVPGEENAKDSNIAVITKSSSGTYLQQVYNSVGKVTLYQQTSTPSVTSIASLGGSNYSFPRDSGGYSATLKTELTYDLAMSNQIFYGSGGVAGGNFLVKDGTSTDIAVGIPTLSKQMTSPSAVTISANGAAMVHFSLSGNYANYKPGQSPGTPSSWHLINPSLGQEGGILADQAVNVGNVNDDEQELPEIAVRNFRETENIIEVKTGSLNSTGSLRYDTPGAALRIDGDTTMGYRFLRVGKMATNLPDAYFATAKDHSYFLFKQNGRISDGTPTQGVSVSGGGEPRRISSGSGTDYLPFGDANFFNSELSSSADSHLLSLSNFAVGDFNGDGYSDLAAGYIMNLDDSAIVSSSTKGVGRVLIFYGGAEDGLQQRPDSTGYKLDANTFANSNPCASDGTGCKIQILATPDSSKDDGFGSSILSYPVTCGTTQASMLVVKGTSQPFVAASGQTPAVAANTKTYSFKPNCMGATTNKSGLGSVGEVLPVPTGTLKISSTFGLSMTVLARSKGANNADTFLVASDRTNKSIFIYGLNSSNSFVYKEGFSYSTVNAFTAGSYSGDLTVGFGTQVIDAGDLNGDGFDDLMVNVAGLRRDDSTPVTDQGAYLVIFGGDIGETGSSVSGLRYKDTSSGTLIPPSANASTASCYTKPDATGAGSPRSICNPILYFLPQLYTPSNPAAFVRNGKYERTYLSPFSLLNPSVPEDLNENESAFSNLSVPLLGSPGRDGLELNSSTRILKGGVLYVVP